MKKKGILAIVLGAALVLGGCGGERCAHEWSAWETETAATCTEEGSQRRSCPKCGKEERQKISAPGHEWGSWKEKEAPTCIKNGKQERECERCHEKETKDIEAIGHAEGVWASDGEGHWRECPVCKEALTQKEPHLSEGGDCPVCGGRTVGLEFAVYESECHVIGIGTEEGDIVIPATYAGKPVTEIGEDAFYRESITSVVIPNSVIYIRPNAFSNCNALRRAKLGNSVRVIGEQAFNWATALAEITLPASLEIIEDGAFNQCGITAIEFPSGLQSIGKNAFYKSALQNLTIPDHVSTIGDSAFYGCENLESIKVGRGVKELPHMFCYGLKSGSKLTSVVLSEGLETIGDAAFANNKLLTKITIPSSVRTIDDGAFEYTGLTEIVIPDTVETLASAVFYNCKSLTRAVVGNGVSAIGDVQQTSGVGTFEECDALTDMTVGSGVRQIAQRTFRGCVLLTSITFRGTTDEWKEIEKGTEWKPSRKEVVWWTSVLEQVVCRNGTLVGEEID